MDVVEELQRRLIESGKIIGSLAEQLQRSEAHVADLKMAASTRRESPGDAFRVRVLEASRKAGSTLEYDELDELPFKSGKALEWMVDRVAELEETRTWYMDIPSGPCKIEYKRGLLGISPVPDSVGVTVRSDDSEDG